MQKQATKGNRLNRGMTKRMSSVKDPQQMIEAIKREEDQRMIKECIESIRGLKQLC